jgi:hypothetical protein
MTATRPTRSALLAALLLMAACGGDGATEPPPVEPPPPPPPPPPAAAAVTLDRTAAMLVVGGRVQLVAVPRDAAGQPLGGATVTWSVTGGAATVTPQGLVSGAAPGEASIVATSGQATARATISVVQGIAGTTTVVPGDSLLTQGDSTTVSVRSFDANGVATGPPRWSSSNPAVVTVDSMGRVRAAGAGAASVIATTPAGSGSVTLRVAAAVPAAAIAASKTAVCALAMDGRLFCAGLGYGPAPMPVAPELRFSDVDGFGDRITDTSGFCALTAEGAAYCWGTNDSGQLGVGDTRSRSAPTAVEGGLQFDMLSAGDFHTCGITRAGEAFCWGAGSNGQLGNGDTASSSVPVRVAIDEPLAQVSAGQGSSCALTRAGRIYCWGFNRAGQVGDNSVPHNTSTPRPVTANVTFAGLNRRQTNFVCAVSTAGEPYCWGNTNPLRVGDIQCPLPEGGTHACWPVPTRLGTPLRFNALTANAIGGMCGVTTDQRIACWGLNILDRFGIAGVCAQGCADPQVGPAGFTKVAGSVYTNCGLRQDGVPFCWGSNAQGQFGTPASVTGEAVAVPVRFRLPPG